MKKFYLCFTVALLGLGAAMHWQPSHASDNEPLTAADSKQDLVETLELISRIEGLEKRLAALEDRDSLVRQVDNREPSAVPQPERFVPTTPVTTESERPNLDDSNGTTDFDSDDDLQNTNGQKWSFRLLIDRKSQRPALKSPNHVREATPAKSSGRSPTA